MKWSLRSLLSWVAWSCLTLALLTQAKLQVNLGVYRSPYSQRVSWCWFFSLDCYNRSFLNLESLPEKEYDKGD